MQVPPPQSTSVSLPFLLASLQLGSDLTPLPHDAASRPKATSVVESKRMRSPGIGSTCSTDSAGDLRKKNHGRISTPSQPDGKKASASRPSRLIQPSGACASSDSATRGE